MKNKIAIQGIAGCFHQMAAQKYFGDSVEIEPCLSFSKVVEKVETGQVDYGIMAIENSIAGSILPNYNLLQRSDLFVVGEVYLQIRQHLLCLPNAKLSDISEVQSHPMALLQCDSFLGKYPNWKLIESEDTAWSAKYVHEYNLTDTAAIASSLAAKLYGLQILQKDIHSETNNYTRFLILNKAEKTKEIKEDHKASLYFRLTNQPGVLAKVLECMHQKKINLSKLQSYPIQGTEWQYYFHVDVEFLEMEDFEDMLTCITPLTSQLRVLGIYKKGNTYDE